ncbi:hypothetical protein HXZ66_19295 [Bacillus sp. A116_S68]|nr:hypothetical protein HXZ66_19295 [Bacillus sp. A116_S68]
MARPLLFFTILIFLTNVVTGCGQNNDVTNTNIEEPKHSEETETSTRQDSTWAEVGLSVSSDDTLLVQDLSAFFHAIAAENEESYFFYLNQLENAIDVQMTISHHHDRYLTSALRVSSNIKQLECKTPEMKFVKSHYLQGVSQHVETVEAIEPHIDAINNDSHHLNIITEFNEGITSGHEEIALAFIQILKIVEKTDTDKVPDLKPLKEHVHLYYEAS